MKGPWLKLYTEIVDDPKVQLLEPELFKLYINLLCIAKRTDELGALPPPRELAFLLRMTEKGLRDQIEMLQDQGLIDCSGEWVEVHGWAWRQEEQEREKNAERQRRFKERHHKENNSIGNGTGNAIGNGNSNDEITPLELELDKELDKELERENMAPDEPSPSLAPTEAKKPSPKKPRTAKFTPPTLEELTAYCQERRNSVDPAYWLDYYQTRDWMVGRNKMRDWQAAVRTWERNGYDRPPGKPAVPAKQETEEQRALREKARRLFGPKALREPVGGVP